MISEITGKIPNKSPKIKGTLNKKLHLESHFHVDQALRWVKGMLQMREASAKAVYAPKRSTQVRPQKLVQHIDGICHIDIHQI